MPQVTGRVTITAAGKRYNTREGATLRFSSKSRQGEVSDQGVVGFSEKTEIPEIECTIVHTGATSLKEIEDITDATCVFDTDTGKSYVLSNAWNTAALALSKGEISTKFQGISCDEA